MVIVTGGAGFIGSAIVWRLNEMGEENILVVDELGNDDKWKNLVSLKYKDFINKYDFINEVVDEGLPAYNPKAIIHMGANSSTTEKDADLLLTNNYEYTKILAQHSLKNNVRFIYASSAATYGDGSAGFDDELEKCVHLQPLNMYGYSKQLFDLWAMRCGAIDKIVGLKYFNVYGPNEYHKGDMRSVVHKAFEQVVDSGKVRLFKSLNKDYKDGEQKRDFIYIKDAVNITIHFLEHPDKNGLFNVGSGNARTWNDLATALFNAVNKTKVVEYIDLPDHLADKYQYFTEANISRLRKSGYKKPINSLEDGINDYAKNYLLGKQFLGM